MTRFIFRSVVTASPVESAGRGGRGAPEGRGAAGEPQQAAEAGRADRRPGDARQAADVDQRRPGDSPRRRASASRCSSSRTPATTTSARRGSGINTEAGVVLGVAEGSRPRRHARHGAHRGVSPRRWAQEWRAIGLRAMYGYMADLSTEPRWYRVHECFTEDADLCRRHHEGARREAAGRRRSLRRRRWRSPSSTSRAAGRRSRASIRTSRSARTRSIRPAGSRTT